MRTDQSWHPNQEERTRLKGAAVAFAVFVGAILLTLGVVHLVARLG